MPLPTVDDNDVSARLMAVRLRDWPERTDVATPLPAVQRAFHRNGVNLGTCQGIRSGRITKTGDACFSIAHDRALAWKKRGLCQARLRTRIFGR